MNKNVEITPPSQADKRELCFRSVAIIDQLNNLYSEASHYFSRQVIPATV